MNPNDFVPLAFHPTSQTGQHFHSISSCLWQDTSDTKLPTSSVQKDKRIDKECLQYSSLLFSFGTKYKHKLSTAGADGNVFILSDIWSQTKVQDTLKIWLVRAWLKDIIIHPDGHPSSRRDISGKTTNMNLMVETGDHQSHEDSWTSV